jgi:hypothetical protein
VTLQGLGTPNCDVSMKDSGLSKCRIMSAVSYRLTSRKNRNLNTNVVGAAKIAEKSPTRTGKQIPDLQIVVRILLTL